MIRHLAWKKWVKGMSVGGGLECGEVSLTELAAADRIPQIVAEILG